MKTTYEEVAEELKSIPSMESEHECKQARTNVLEKHGWNKDEFLFACSERLGQ